MMRRRQFITLLGGAAAAWPLAARGQQTDQIRRIGVLTVFSKDDPEGQRRVAALLQLQQLGWTDGHNVAIELRWAGGDPDRSRFYAGEFVGMKPDVIFVMVMPLLQRATRTIPIVFAQIADPVAEGFVASLANHQRSFEKPLRLAVLALESIHVGQVVERRAHIGVTRAERLLADDQRALEEPLRLFVLALRSIHER